MVIETNEQLWMRTAQPHFKDFGEVAVMMEQLFSSRRTRVGPSPILLGVFIALTARSRVPIRSDFFWLSNRYPFVQ